MNISPEYPLVEWYQHTIALSQAMEKMAPSDMAGWSQFYFETFYSNPETSDHWRRRFEAAWTYYWKHHIEIEMRSTSDFDEGEELSILALIDTLYEWFAFGPAQSSDGPPVADFMEKFEEEAELLRRNTHFALCRSCRMIESKMLRPKKGMPSPA